MWVHKKSSTKVLLAVAFSAQALSVQGFCNWGPDGTGASSVCQGGAQGGDWCNANQNQCESGCGGKWCSGGTTGFCNWGPDGTSASSVCEGGAQGGDWCNANQNQCQSGCGGKWCTSSAGPPPPPPPPVGGGECGDGWTQASWTTYTSYAPCCRDSPTYDPSADTTECWKYSACSYLGDFAYIGHKSYDFVRSNNLISFWSAHGDGGQSFGNKKIRIAAGGKTIEALVADTCGDGDCDGCCTDNASPSGYLVDMEYHTVVNNFGSIDAVGGQVCWQLVDGTGGGGGGGGSSGFCNWGPDGTGSSSVCQGGAQGGDWCNASQSQCESGCGGKWCT